jgi:hypothetical protein
MFHKKQKQLATGLPPVAPQPLKHWARNAPNVERLRTLVQDPVFALAVATARAAYAPSGATLAGRDPHQLAVAHAYYAGFCDFADALQNLTVLDAEPDQPAAEWDYVQS